jgi:predicted nucleic acid-binding protein
LLQPAHRGGVKVVVVVDTSVLIDYFNDRITPHTLWLEREMDLVRIGITSLTVCEVLQGIREEDEFVETKEALEQFEIIEAGGWTLAVASARNFKALRKRGITIRNTIDCLIATSCIKGGHTLLHNDHDFDGFEKHLGLQVVYPL